MSEFSDSSDSTLTCTSLDDGDEVFWGTPKSREIELEKAYLEAFDLTDNHGGFKANIYVNSKRKSNSSDKSIRSTSTGNKSNQSLGCLLDNNINGDNSQSSEQDCEVNKFNLLDGSLSQISFTKTNLCESTSMDNNSDDSVLTLNSTTNNVNARGFLNLVDALLTNKLNEEKNNEQDDNNVESDVLPEPILNSNISISDVDMSEDTLNHVIQETIDSAELSEHVKISQSCENTFIGENISKDAFDLSSNQQVTENKLEMNSINTPNTPNLPFFENSILDSNLTGNGSKIFESDNIESNELPMDSIEFNNNFEPIQNKCVLEPTIEASTTLNLSNNSSITEVNDSKRSEEISFGNILEKNISSEASLDLSTSTENTLTGDYIEKTQANISSVIDEKYQQFESNPCTDKSIIEAELKSTFDLSITSEVDKNKMIERKSLSSNVESPLAIDSLEEEKMETNLELSKVNEKCQLQIKGNDKNEINDIENNSSESNEHKIIGDMESKAEHEFSTVDEQQMKCELQTEDNDENQMIDYCPNIDNNLSESNENKITEDMYLENREEKMETNAENELLAIDQKYEQLAAKSDVEKSIIDDEPKNLLVLSNLENNSSESNEHIIIEDEDMVNLEEGKIEHNAKLESTVDEKCEQAKGDVEKTIIDDFSNIENVPSESNVKENAKNMDLENLVETMETNADNELSTIDQKCELKINIENQIIDEEPKNLLDLSNFENNSSESNGNKITEDMCLKNNEETMETNAVNELSSSIIDQKCDQLAKSDVEKTIIDEEPANILDLSNSENNSSESNEHKIIEDKNLEEKEIDTDANELSPVEKFELQANVNVENQIIDEEPKNILDLSDFEINSFKSNEHKIVEDKNLEEKEIDTDANELSTVNEKFERQENDNVENQIIDEEPKNLLNLSNFENNSSESNEHKIVEDRDSKNISTLTLPSNVESTLALENVEKEKFETNSDHNFSLTKMELPAVDQKYESILDRDNTERAILDAESLLDLNEMNIDNSPVVTEQEFAENTYLENIENNNSKQILLDTSNISILTGENVKVEMPVIEENEETELLNTDQAFDEIPITSVFEGSMNVEQKNMLILSNIEENLKANESKVKENTSIDNINNEDSPNSLHNVVQIEIETNKKELKEPNLYLNADLLDSDIQKDFKMNCEPLNLDILEKYKEAISENPVSNSAFNKNLLDSSINEVAFKFNENQNVESSISETINEAILDDEITGNVLKNKVELNLRAVNSESNALLNLSSEDDVAEVKSSEVMDFEENTNLFTECLNNILPKVDSCKSLLDMSLSDFELKSNDNEKSEKQEINNIDTNMETSHSLAGNLLLSENLLDLSLSNLEDKLITQPSHEEEFQIGMDKINENAKSLIESPIVETNEAILIEENILDKKESASEEPIEFNNLFDMDMPESLLDTSDNRLKKDAFIKTESMPETASKRKLAVSANNTESKRPRVLIPPTDLSKLRSPLTSISRSAMSRVNTNLGSIQKKLILDEDSVGKSISKLARPTTMGALCHSKLRTPSDYNSSNEKIQQKMSACKSSQIPTNLPVASGSKLNFSSCTSAIPTLASGIKSSIPTSIGGIPPSGTKAKGSRLPTLNSMQLGR